MEKDWARLGKKEILKMARITKSAARLFNERGFLETSMDDISSAARLSKGGIYHYFSSKNEILFFISVKFMDLLLNGLEEEVQGIPDPSKKIKFVISRHIRLYTQHTSEAKTVIHEAYQLPAEYFKVINRKERQYHQIVSNILTDFFKGEVSKEELKTIAFILFGTCNGIYYWYDPGGSIPPRYLSTMIEDIISGGLRCFEKKRKTRGKEETKKNGD